MPARPRAAAGEPKSLLAERSEFENNPVDKKVESALVRKRYTPLLYKCNDFNVYGVFGRDSRW